MGYTPPHKYTARELIEMEIDDWQADVDIEVRCCRRDSAYAKHCRARIILLVTKLKESDS